MPSFTQSCHVRNSTKTEYSKAVTTADEYIYIYIYINVFIFSRILKNFLGDNVYLVLALLLMAKDIFFLNDETNLHQLQGVCKRKALIIAWWSWKRQTECSDF